MNSQRPILVALSLLLAACGGGGLSGTYTPSGGAGFFEKLTFTSDKTAEITFMGQTREIGYEVDGKRLKIINPNAGETQIFTIDDTGCFDGGGFIGKYCRTDGIAALLSGRELAGTWEAKAPGGSLRLTFGEGNKVRLTIADNSGTPQTDDVNYEVAGNRVTISAPGGPAVELIRKGDSLTGDFGGLTVTFTHR